MRMRVAEFWAWISERESIRLKRAAGKPKPWTSDPIFQQYRFCNVNREEDAVTKWIAANWRDNHKDAEDLWFAMAVARLINWPESLAEVTSAIFNSSGKVHWKPDQFVRRLDERKDRGEKVFTGAYMIHADATPTTSKVNYLAHRVLTPMWDSRRNVRAVIERSADMARGLRNVHSCLMTFRDFGSFMAGQVIADIKYTPRFRKFRDWWTFAAIGPGSMRGMNRVIGNDVKAKWDEEEWLFFLEALRTETNERRLKANFSELHAQDIQNCLCEFDKYERVRLGEGKPRSTFAGA